MNWSGCPDPRAASGTASVWLQLTWVAAAYALLRTLGLGRRSAAAWTAANVPDGAIAVSEQLQREFRDQFGRDTVHIPNGVAVTDEQPVAGGADPLEQRNLWPEQAPDLTALVRLLEHQVNCYPLHQNVGTSADVGARFDEGVPGCVGTTFQRRTSSSTPSSRSTR